jgi:hypothetical protein
MRNCSISNIGLVQFLLVYYGSMTGGLVAFLMSAFTLVSARSTVDNRSFRIAVLEGKFSVRSIQNIACIQM